MSYCEFLLRRSWSCSKRIWIALESWKSEPIFPDTKFRLCFKFTWPRYICLWCNNIGQSTLFELTPVLVIRIVFTLNFFLILFKLKIEKGAKILAQNERSHREPIGLSVVLSQSWNFRENKRRQESNMIFRHWFFESSSKFQIHFQLKKCSNEILVFPRKGRDETFDIEILADGDVFKVHKIILLAQDNGFWNF